LSKAGHFLSKIVICDFQGAGFGDFWRFLEIFDMVLKVFGYFLKIGFSGFKEL
jgi:hypothetical protein